MDGFRDELGIVVLYRKKAPKAVCLPFLVKMRNLSLVSIDKRLDV